MHVPGIQDVKDFTTMNDAQDLHEHETTSTELEVSARDAISLLHWLIDTFSLDKDIFSGPGQPLTNYYLPYQLETASSSPEFHYAQEVTPYILSYPKEKWYTDFTPLTLEGMVIEHDRMRVNCGCSEVELAELEVCHHTAFIEA